jgi:hypothetical protein
MRKGILVAGIAVALIGVGILALGLTALTATETIPPPSTGSLLVISPSILGGGTATLTWSDANQTFRFAVYQCTDSSCNSLASNAPLANGAGASGSKSFPVNGGTSYAVKVESQDTTNNVPVTITVSGLGFLMLIGIAIAAVGGILAIVGVLMRAKPKPKAPPPAPAAPAPMFVTKPFRDTQGAAATAYTPAPPRVERSGEGA